MYLMAKALFIMQESDVPVLLDCRVNSLAVRCRCCNEFGNSESLYTELGCESSDAVSAHWET